jgi:hypothetical protein
MSLVNSSPEETDETANANASMKWSYKEHKVVAVRPASARRVRPKSRQVSRAEDDFSIHSSATRQSSKWDHRLKKTVPVEFQGTRWDRRTKTPVRMNRYNKISSSVGTSTLSSNGSAQLSGYSTTGSPKSTVVAFEDLPSSLESPKTGPKVTRPKSADTAAQRKKMKELELRTLLIRMNSSSSKQLHGSDGEKSATVNAELTEMNALLNKKNLVLEEQQRMIRDLMEEIQSEKSKSDGNLPTEIVASEERPQSPVSHIGSIFSSILSPLFEQPNNNRRQLS